MRSIGVALALLSLAVAFGSLATAQSVAATRSPQPTQVVFVCEHGTVKSLVAMEYFNRRSKDRGLPYRAVARGTAPEPALPAAVREGLHADGFDVSGFVPRLLSASDVDGVALVVSFDDDITNTVGGRARYLKWDDLPGVLTDHPRGRDAIVRRVDALIEALARSGSQ
jgi:arsenate reductase (thioredoxin)